MYPNGLNLELNPLKPAIYPPSVCLQFGMKYYNAISAVTIYSSHTITTFVAEPCRGLLFPSLTQMHELTMCFTGLSPTSFCRKLPLLFLPL